MAKRRRRVLRFIRNVARWMGKAVKAVFRFALQHPLAVAVVAVGGLGTWAAYRSYRYVSKAYASVVTKVDAVVLGTKLGIQAAAPYSLAATVISWVFL